MFCGERFFGLIDGSWFFIFRYDIDLVVVILKVIVDLYVWLVYLNKKFYFGGVLFFEWNRC